MGLTDTDQQIMIQWTIESMGHDMAAPMSSEPVTHDHPRGAGVVNVAEAPMNRLAEPGLGLENEPHRVLTYADLKSLDMNPDMRAPERELELHLTSNMERYMWSFDGKKYSEVREPVVFNAGERLRLTMVNDTMMAHPIHLHGMFFDVVTGKHHHKPRKHTIVVKPGEKLSVDVSPDEDMVGDWAFHCHLLYHMMAGMMRTVSVKASAHDPSMHQDDHDGHDMHEGHDMQMKSDGDDDHQMHREEKPMSGHDSHKGMKH